MVEQSHPVRKQIRLDAATYAQEGVVCSITVCTENRTPVFLNQDLTSDCAALLRSRSDATNVQVHAYCFMPDHLHLLLSPSSMVSLLDFLRDHKSRSTRLAWRHDHKGALWQARYYDHFLRKDEDVLIVVDYIVNNPVRKGIAAQSSQYPYCGSFVYELWPQSAG